MELEKKNSQPWLRWLGTLLAVGLLIYLLSRQGWDEIVVAFRQVSAWRFILALGLTVVSRLAVTGRWHVLLSGAGLPITISQSLKITFAGLFASNFLPTTIGGDVVRLGGVLRLGFDRAVCLASLVVDRLVGMAGMAMALVTLPFTLPAVDVNQFFQMGVGVPVIPSRTVRHSQGLFQKTWGKGVEIIQHLGQALAVWLKKPEVLLTALAFTLLHMTCVFLSVWLLLDGMGERLSFWLIAGLWSATYFVTLLPISINGLGVQELSLAFFYSTLGGVSVPGGLMLALFMRVLPMFASLPGAGFIPHILAGKEK